MKRLILEQEREEKEITVTIKGHPESVKAIETFLYRLAINAGHSSTMCIAWDGDGHDRIQVEGLTLSKEEEKNIALGREAGIGDFEVTNHPDHVSTYGGASKLTKQTYHNGRLDYYRHPLGDTTISFVKTDEGWQLGDDNAEWTFEEALSQMPEWFQKEVNK